MRRRAVSVSPAIGSILIAAAVSLIAGCAQKGRPSGGPPDTTPPHVASTIPPDGAVNVARSARFTITFSEPIAATTLNGNLFVSPPLAGLPKFEWKDGGRTVVVNWNDSLRVDATYRLTIGARVADRRKNTFPKAHTLAFATGATLDRGRISGRVESVASSGDVRTFEVFAFAGESFADSFYLAEPDYKTQTGTDSVEGSGWFELPYLRAGHYRILAFADQDRNRKYDPGEMYGLPPTASVFLPDAQSSARVAILIAPRDTTGFCLGECRVTPWGGVSVVCTQQVDTLAWPAGTVTVHDEETGEAVAIELLRPATLRPSYITMRSAELVAGRRYNLTLAGWTSRQGEPLCEEARCTVTMTALEDTVGPKVEWVSLPDRRNGRSAFEPMVIQFSEPLAPVAAEQVFAVTDTGGVAVPGSVEWHDARTLAFTPQPSWPEGMTVTATLDSAQIANLNGRAAPPGVFKWSFAPLSPSRMGAIEGQIARSGAPLPCRLEIRQVRGTTILRGDFTAPGPFRMDVPEGNWLISGFLDLDSNGHWLPGALLPFQPPEPRAVLSDTLAVRSRFTLEDLTVRFAQ